MWERFHGLTALDQGPCGFHKEAKTEQLSEDCAFVTIPFSNNKNSRLSPGARLSDMEAPPFSPRLRNRQNTVPPCCWTVKLVPASIASDQPGACSSRFPQVRASLATSSRKTLASQIWVA